MVKVIMDVSALKDQKKGIVLQSTVSPCKQYVLLCVHTSNILCVCVSNLPSVSHNCDEVLKVRASPAFMHVLLCQDITRPYMHMGPEI